jgi:hypothetical protein
LSIWYRIFNLKKKKIGQELKTYPMAGGAPVPFNQAGRKFFRRNEGNLF